MWEFFATWRTLLYFTEESFVSIYEEENFS